MINGSALLCDGTLKGEFVPTRYGVQVMCHTESGERAALSDVMAFDKRYGLHGELSAVDVAENLQELYVNLTDNAYPAATVYASQAMFREACETVGTYDAETDTDYAADPANHNIGCACIVCIPGF